MDANTRLELFVSLANMVVPEFAQAAKIFMDSSMEQSGLPFIRAHPRPSAVKAFFLTKNDSVTMIL